MKRFFLVGSFASHDTRRSKGLFILIVASMSVAFTAIVVTASILQGFTNMLSEGEIGWLGHVVIQPKKGDFTIENIDGVRQELDKIDGIKSYAVRSQAVLNIKYKDEFYQPYITIGTYPSNEESVSLLKDKLISGDFIDKSKPDEVAIGRLLAQAFKGNPYSKSGKKIEIGEEIDIISQSGVMKTYKIGGIIDGKTFIPNWLLIIDKDELEKLDATRKDSQIVIKLKNLGDMEKVKEEIQDLDLGLDVFTWRELAGYADDIIAGVSFITMLINALIIVTVFVVISIIIFINILDKKRQIGILKSMGANNRFVTNVYVFETITYVFWSCVVGLSISFVINFYSTQNPISMLIGDFHTAMDAKIILISVAIMFAASVGGTLIPTRIATKIKISDVIRDNA